ncbi:MAG: class II aldolase/adducin family protein [Spirochaetes bacterium]|nr:class II aldolase/adducin family protein [Spirochaetota bacterium]
MGNYDQYKKSILECSAWLCREGFFGTLLGTGGNVSMRSETEDVFVITPSSLRYESLTPDDVCVLDFNMKQLEGKHAPSVEASMHLAVYKNRADVGAVVHTHQPCASVLAVTNTPLPALFDEVMFSIGEMVEVVPYGLSGSEDLVKNVTSKLGNLCNCYFMQNHGALSLGEDLEKAWLNAELLEKASRVYCQALATGREVMTIPEPTLSGLVAFRRDTVMNKARANEEMRKPKPS